MTCPVSEDGHHSLILKSSKYYVLFKKGANTFMSIIWQTLRHSYIMIVFEEWKEKNNLSFLYKDFLSAVASG